MSAKASPRASGDTWTVRTLLSTTRGFFEERGVDAARLTAELLLAHVLGWERVKLFTEFDRPVDEKEIAAYRDLVRRRAAGEPTQYLVGWREFYGRRFKCDRRALIPRPETEQVVEFALGAIGGDGAGRRALDLGCGTGAIGITLAKERTALNVTLTDLSAGAAALSRENAAALGVADRCDVRAGDLYAALRPGELFDVIASNPPYVPHGRPLPREIAEHEPPGALAGGEDGLEVARRVVGGAPSWLSPGGLLAMEIDEEQGEAARSLCVQAGLVQVRVFKDLRGLDRVVVATWTP